MRRRITLAIVLSLLMIAVSASSVFSAKEAWESPRYNPIIRQVVDYALPMEQPRIGFRDTRNGNSPTASLGTSVPSASPGAAIGNTYYDYQTNNRMNRRTQVGRNWDTDLNDSLTLIHAVWMDLLGPDLQENVRTAGYGAYSAADGVYLTEVNIGFDPTYSGYFELEVSESNHAIVCGHWTPDGNTDLYTPTVWYDDSPGEAGFWIASGSYTTSWGVGTPRGDHSRGLI